MTDTLVDAGLVTGHDETMSWKKSVGRRVSATSQQYAQVQRTTSTAAVALVCQCQDRALEVVAPVVVASERVAQATDGRNRATRV